MYITYVIDRIDTYNNPTVVVLSFVTVSFFLHFPPLHTGHSNDTSAQNGYVMIPMSAMIITACLLTIPGIM